MAGVRDKMLKNNVFTVEYDGETYQLAKLTSAALAGIQLEVAELNESTDLDEGQRNLRIAALMLVFSVLDGNELAFTTDDVDFVVNELPVGLVTKIGKAVNAQNGLFDSEEDIAKNS